MRAAGLHEEEPLTTDLTDDTDSHGFERNGQQERSAFGRDAGVNIANTSEITVDN